jgi:hypothetical protein
MHIPLVIESGHEIRRVEAGIDGTGRIGGDESFEYVLRAAALVEPVMDESEVHWRESVRGFEPLAKKSSLLKQADRYVKSTN